MRPVSADEGSPNQRSDSADQDRSAAPSVLRWLADAEPPPSGPHRAVDLARWHIERALGGDAAVESTRTRMLAFMDAHPDVLERTCVSGHLTSSSLVVDAVASRVLLLHHTKLRRWLQPGGHVDGVGDLVRSALREATEETGIGSLRAASPAIDLDIHRVSSPNEPAHVHLDVRFLIMAPAGAAPVGNHESTELRWVHISELQHYQPDPGLRRLIGRGLHLAELLGPPPP